MRRRRVAFGYGTVREGADVELPGDRRRAGGRRRWGTVVQDEDAANRHKPEDGSRWRPHTVALQHVSDVTTVDDPTLLRAMFHLWERLKVVVEPTGALGAAAALYGTSTAGSVRGKRVGVILSGGNVDLAQVGGWMAKR